MKDIRPFLSAIPGAKTIGDVRRSLGSALSSVPTEPVTSWLPRSNELVQHDVEINTSSIEAEARERGYAEGLAETAELRAQLQAAIAALNSGRAALAEPVANKIALAASAVISAWTHAATDKDLYAPVIASWIENVSGPSTAFVPTTSVVAIKEMFGDAQITVTPDPSMKKGDIRLSSGTRELAHSWDAKLLDLREAMSNALESQS